MTQFLRRLSAFRQRWEARLDTYLLGIPPRAENPYSTHVPILAGLARLLCIRRVLELGCGEYSTAVFLNRTVFPDLEKLHSIENDRDWANRILRSYGHDARLSMQIVHGAVAPSISSLCFDDYDLILIDDSNSLKERSRTIGQVVNCFPQRPVIVVHDYECPPYRRAASRAAHRYRFTALNPNTGVVWNFEKLRTKSLRSLNNQLRRETQNSKRC